MTGCVRKWSKTSVATFFLAVRSSRRRTTPIEIESVLVYMKPPPPTPSVQSPTTAKAAPSSPVTLNRASMVSLGKVTTHFTPVARWFKGCFVRSPTSWAVSYTHLRDHETDSYLVCRLLLEKKKKTHNP